jgi:hypothetical protein
MRPGKTKPAWPIYDTLASTVQSASDHAAIWVDLAL